MMRSYFGVAICRKDLDVFSPSVWLRIGGQDTGALHWDAPLAHSMRPFKIPKYCMKMAKIMATITTTTTINTSVPAATVNIR